MLHGWMLTFLPLKWTEIKIRKHHSSSGTMGSGSSATLGVGAQLSCRALFLERRANMRPRPGFPLRFFSATVASSSWSFACAAGRLGMSCQSTWCYRREAETSYQRATDTPSYATWRLGTSSWSTRCCQREAETSCRRAAGASSLQPGGWGRAAGAHGTTIAEKS